jgi:hypothetical protein
VGFGGLGWGQRGERHLEGLVGLNSWENCVVVAGMENVEEKTEVVVRARG